MNFKEISAGTPKLLKGYLDLLNQSLSDNQIYTSPTPSEYSNDHSQIYSDNLFLTSYADSSILSSKRYSQNPDIKFFRRIKDKHHFAYHRARKQHNTIDKIDSRMSSCDPYDRNSLLRRITTYTALNWNLPTFSTKSDETNTNNEKDKSRDDLTELKCARNGWSCVSISINNNTKNHIMCTSCHEQLILKFNDISPSLSAPFDFDWEDYEELNTALKNQYIEQITKTGHSNNCPWISFETPVEGVYYLRPHLNSTNEIMINDYLDNLINLIDNHQVLLEKAAFLPDLIKLSRSDINISESFKEFIKVSNVWILNRCFSDNKENFSLMLSLIPTWFYQLAMYGWNLNIQSFSDKLVLLLICSKCNKRVFLNSSQHATINKNDIFGISPSTNLAVSASKILTPCKFPPMVSRVGQHDEFSVDIDSEGNEDEEDLGFDLLNEHKGWCCNNRNFGDESYFDYFTNMVIQSEKNVDNNGEFKYDCDMMFDVDDSLNNRVKRKKSFDVNEGLDRLNKLRKLYLIDERS